MEIAPPKLIDESAIDVAYLLSRIDDLEMEVKDKTLKLNQVLAELNMQHYQFPD
jgi:hypothetical protein